MVAVCYTLSMRMFFTHLRATLRHCRLIRESGWYRVQLPGGAKIEVWNAVAIHAELGERAFYNVQSSVTRQIAYNNFGRTLGEALGQEIVRASFRPEVIRTATARSNHIRRVYSRLLALQNANKNLTTSNLVA